MILLTAYPVLTKATYSLITRNIIIFCVWLQKHCFVYYTIVCIIYSSVCWLQLANSWRKSDSRRVGWWLECRLVLQLVHSVTTNNLHNLWFNFIKWDESCFWSSKTEFLVVLEGTLAGVGSKIAFGFLDFSNVISSMPWDHLLFL